MANPFPKMDDTQAARTRKRGESDSMMRRISVIVITGWIAASNAAAEPTDARFDTDLRRRVKTVNERVVDWRRGIHERPELSNREFLTSALVARELRGMGIEVREKIAHTAILLGAAQVLSDLREELPGTVLFLFQPAEERPPLAKQAVPS